MFAIAAAFVFALGFILALLGTSTHEFNLLYLGLTLLALHLVFPVRAWGRSA